MSLRIGVDFDNTIVCYDDLFHRLALERGLIHPSVPRDKTAVRDHVRENGQEDAWIEMQGHVYGDRMSEAVAFPGVEDFFETCAARDIETFIVSHKTRYPNRGGSADLHEAAR